MSGKRIALIFSIFCGIGVVLFALVWRTKGTLSAVVGIIAALFVIGSLKWLEKAIDEWYKQKRATKKLEDEVYTKPDLKQHWNSANQSLEITDTSPPPPFTPQINLRAKQKLSWIFGILTLLGAVLGLWGDKLPAPFKSVAMGLGIPMTFWGIFMFAAVREKSKPEKPAQDFSHLWSNRPVFRRNILLIGLLSFVVGFTGIVLAPPPPNAAPMLIATLIGLFIIHLFNLFYIQFSQQNAVPGFWAGWSTGEKRLKKFVDVAIVVLLIVGFPILSILMSNFIHELYFSLVFAGVGLLVGYFVHDFLKNRFEGMNDADERKWEILLKVYTCCLILTLCTAAFFNRKTADYATETRKYPVADKSKTRKGKTYLWLEIDGKNKRFEPNLTEWEDAQIGDSLPVLVGKGRLGFEVILQYGVPPADSSFHK